MFLSEPSVVYKYSFLAAVEEFQGEERTLDFITEGLEDNFEAFVLGMCERAEGKHLPPGYVPESVFWLIDNDVFIGRVSIRHELSDFLYWEGGHIGYAIRPSARLKGYGKKILELALPEAKKLGILKVLVTCDDDNVGSRKIIEANGGVFENAVPSSSRPVNKLRYWITLG
ncbi:MAG: GNAT family N-acetyltransferase [bacterium]